MSTDTLRPKAVPTGRATAASLVPVLAFATCMALPMSAQALPAPATQEAAADNRSIDQLLQAAREAARTDRNRDAADLFAQAIERAPQRRGELLREYADQLNSGRAGAAVALYWELLGGSAPPEERQQVLSGLGLALLWSDQPSQAGVVYQELLRADPANIDARRNLGRALSWSGRQREAAGYLQELLLAHPQDTEARLLLAQAQSWMGRPDLARRTLAGRQDGQDARRLHAEVERNTAPRTRADYVRSSQSDQLDITGARVGHEFSFTQGLGTAGCASNAGSSRATTAPTRRR